MTACLVAGKCPPNKRTASPLYSSLTTSVGASSCRADALFRARRRHRGDRHVRSAGRGPPRPPASAQTEAPGKQRADPLHRQPQRNDLGPEESAGRECAWREPASARPVPRIQGSERAGAPTSRRSPPASSCRRRPSRPTEARLSFAKAARASRKG